MSHFVYSPDPKTPYIGVKLPAEQLAAVDAARMNLHQNRSAFVQNAIAAYLEQLQSHQ